MCVFFQRGVGEGHPDGSCVALRSRVENSDSHSPFTGRVARPLP